MGKKEQGNGPLPPPLPENSSRFFRNTACDYFPCHPGADPQRFNCLFCFCPLYFLDGDCGGNFTRTKAGVKDCTTCLLPHSPEGYDYILKKLRKAYGWSRKK